MKKMLLVLIPVLLIGTAVASFAGHVSRVEAVGLAPVEADVSGVEPSSGTTVGIISPCKADCREDYWACLASRTVCYAIYLECVAACPW